MAPRNFSEGEIREWCAAYLARTLDDIEAPIDPGISFAALGLDSGSSVHFMVELEEFLGRELDPETIFDHPTIAALASYLAGEGAAG